MILPAEVYACLFGEGSDARIAGVPFRNCPVQESDLRRYWQSGWLHVHRHWAKGWDDKERNDKGQPIPRLHPTRKIPDMPTPIRGCNAHVRG